MRRGLLGGAVTMLALAACGEETDDTGGVGGGDSGPSHALVDGVRLTAVDVNQGVRRAIMDNGTVAVSSVPLLSNRSALMRLYYEVDPAVYNGSPVIARLTMGGQTVVEAAATISGASTLESPASTINIT